MDKKAINLETKVKQSGNSLAVAISSVCKEITGFEKGQTVYLCATNGKLTVTAEPQTIKQQ